ncbi:CmpA/NrtA family ABC transporter substrate-binding protein [Ruixingdingia sedimenti]|uniref:CmpA/NrtA family ABC transporter substrate-binding protein n=1 Tax=Ruixingdingia sedimenti TaxID=3073604 RepID=A0ABU1F525_9RHOB|nr:CmpA/NrtA family ABC transporter substrate-binding protein [Xinfangfangia sp. LG-4]MDR5651929.1 CmpA/NrtA family ABC transporter substrate-binding protein [Xinfangfangia sp. LG-4]
MTAAITLGFVPLLDAAPLIVAAELGFAEQEGLRLRLCRAASWSQLRDLLDLGAVEAAHMLSAMPVARALGLGGGQGGLEVLMVLSLNGQVVGLSGALGPVPFGDPAVAAGLAAPGRVLRFGVPFPFSMHALLLRYWLSRMAPDLAFTLHAVPPPRMTEALQAAEIDGFCVGEPWGTRAVQVAGARLILPGAAIWSQSPEKVLAARHGWAEADPARAAALMRAVWRAGRWAEDPANRTTLAELLAQPHTLDTPALHMEPALRGRVLPDARGPEVAVPQLLAFHAGLANFPWRSQAGWIGAELAAAHGLDPRAAARAARAVFRSDLYRRFLGPAGVPLPPASDKLEGALATAESLPAVRGSLMLMRNRFFDGAVFDPAPAE